MLQNILIESRWYNASLTLRVNQSADFGVRGFVKFYFVFEKYELFT